MRRFIVPLSLLSLALPGVASAQLTYTPPGPSVDLEDPAVATSNLLCDSASYSVNGSQSVSLWSVDRFVFAPGTAGRNNTDNNWDDIDVTVKLTHSGTVAVQLRNAVSDGAGGFTCGTEVLDGGFSGSGPKSSLKLGVDIALNNSNEGPYDVAPLTGSPDALCLQISATSWSGATYDLTVDVDRRHRGTITLADGTWVEVYSTHPELFPNLTRSRPANDLVWHYQHGAGRGGDFYFKRGLMAAWAHIDRDLSGPASPEDVAVIVTPEFPAGGRCLDPGQARWNGMSWVGGGGRTDGPQTAEYSAYGVLDQLFGNLLPSLPNLDRVVISGQSGGGQLTNRYAVLSDLPEDFPAVDFDFVPANPSHWLYLTPERPRDLAADWTVPTQANLLTFYERENLAGATCRTNADCDGSGQVGVAGDGNQLCCPSTGFGSGTIDWSGNGSVGSGDDPTSCTAQYDRFPYGLQTTSSTSAYVQAAIATWGTDGLIDRFLARDVTVTYGRKDWTAYNNASEPDATQWCKVRVQGYNRVDRAVDYHDHMCTVADDLGLTTPAQLVRVWSVGHSSDIFRRDIIRPFIFGTGPAGSTACP